jgi:hypothetical protein
MLLHQVGVYDHQTGNVERPVTVLDKWCGDAHDNPVISIDPSGYLWIFSPSHANWTTPSYIHKSLKPYSIQDGFEKMAEGLFAYPQAFWNPAFGLSLFHVQYLEGRALKLITSPDGKNWQPPKDLALIGEGSYQIAHVEGQHLAIIFDFHPVGLGVDGRTNLYYMESFDGGETWKNVFGETLQLPLTTTDNPALVLEAQSQDLLVYIKDLQFDSAGKPIAIYLTSHGKTPGPETGPRIWYTATFDRNQKKWIHTEIARSQNNYDHGALFRTSSGWDLIAPIGVGAQPYNPGGEVVVYHGSEDGRSWQFGKALTQNSLANHCFVRRGIDAHPDFLGFWADGNPREPSPSRLYFCNAKGEVFRLPEKMETLTAQPVQIV